MCGRIRQVSRLWVISTQAGWSWSRKPHSNYEVESAVCIRNCESGNEFNPRLRLQPSPKQASQHQSGPQTGLWSVEIHDCAMFPDRCRDNNAQPAAWPTSQRTHDKATHRQRSRSHRRQAAQDCQVKACRSTYLEHMLQHILRGQLSQCSHQQQRSIAHCTIWRC